MEVQHQVSAPRAGFALGVRPPGDRWEPRGGDPGAPSRVVDEVFDRLDVGTAEEYLRRNLQAGGE